MVLRGGAAYTKHMSIERSGQVSGEAPAMPLEAATVRAELEQFGGEEAVLARTGLGLTELSTEVQFGEFRGSLWEAVKPSLVPAEDRPAEAKICPVGDMVQTAYKEGGVHAVAEKMQVLKLLDKNFGLVISPQTIERAELKKN